MKKLILSTILCLGLAGCGGCRKDCGPCQPECPQEQIYCPECREYHEPEPPESVRHAMQRQGMSQQLYSDESLMDTTMVPQAPVQPTKAQAVQQVQQANGTKAQAQAQARAKEQTAGQITKASAPVIK